MNRVTRRRTVIAAAVAASLVAARLLAWLSWPSTSRAAQVAAAVSEPGRYRQVRFIVSDNFEERYA